MLLEAFHVVLLHHSTRCNILVPSFVKVVLLVFFGFWFLYLKMCAEVFQAGSFCHGINYVEVPMFVSQLCCFFRYLW